MKRHDLDPLDPKIASLLASEKIIVAQKPDVRARAFARARAALVLSVAPLPLAKTSFWRRAPIAMAAGGILVIAVVAAAAFQEGVRMTRPRQEAAAPATTTAPSLPSSVPASEAAPAALPVSIPEVVSTPKPAQAARAVGSDFMAELQLLQQARAAIARRAFGDALAAISEDARRFPSGRLAEEREALRVRALSGLGRQTDVQTAANGFRTRFPRSVLLPRVNEMAKEAPE